MEKEREGKRERERKKMEKEREGKREKKGKRKK